MVSSVVVSPNFSMVNGIIMGKVEVTFQQPQKNVMSYIISCYLSSFLNVTVVSFTQDNTLTDIGNVGGKTIKRNHQKHHILTITAVFLLGRWSKFVVDFLMPQVGFELMTLELDGHRSKPSCHPKSKGRA